MGEREVWVTEYADGSPFRCALTEKGAKRSSTHGWKAPVRYVPEDRIRALESELTAARAALGDSRCQLEMTESELAEMRKRPPKELWDELCEQVAQMCEYLGSNRTDVPCDSWHLRDLIVKLRKREEWTECRDGYTGRRSK